MDYLQVFNDKFIDFLKDLSTVFPDDKDFKVALSSVRLLLMADKSCVHAIFNEKVVGPYSTKIMAKDEGFFLDKSYDHEFEDAIGIVEKLKSYWKSLSEENRIVVWKYLQILVVLDTKIST
jgi:hypothetical protein